jgi:DNA-binding transcriptional LysR family regulator
MALDVDRLRVLVEVAHAGSISEAARRMSFTPSALSQQLGKLEDQLGCRLIDRGARGVRPTEVGALLLEYAERVIGELREAEQAVATAIAHQPQRLRVGTFATAGTALLPATLRELRRTHPQVDVAVTDLEPPDGYGLVTSRDLDILITHRYPGVPSVPIRALVRRELFIDPLRLALPADHPLVHRATVDLAELAPWPWISGAPGVPNRTCLEVLAAAAGFTPVVRHETADYALTTSLVAAGLGMSFIPDSSLATLSVAGIAIVPLTGPPPGRQVCIVHRRRPDPRVAVLVRLLETTSQRDYPSA